MPQTTGDAQTSLIASMGAHAVHATHDSREITAPARRAFMQRFEDEVDPDRLLSEKERRKRAHHALQLHMKRLALRSAQARRKSYPDA